MSRLSTVKALADRFGLDGLAHMEAAAVRHRPVPPRLIARLADDADSVLTKREREVMVLIASGYLRKEVARELWLSEHTVTTHLKNAYAKLGARNRVQAVNAFIEEAA